MGFSGGGSNVLLPHTHDGRVAQDGGELDFNNITQANSSAGQIFYSNGTALQQLAYPGVPAGENLTAVALSTAPAWVAGAAATGTFELVDSQELTGTATLINSSFTSISGGDISCIQVEYDLQLSNNLATFYLQYGSSGALVTTSYNTKRMNITGPTTTSTSLDAAFILTVNPNYRHITGTAILYVADPSIVAAATDMTFTSTTVNTNPDGDICIGSRDGSENSIDQIRISVSAGSLQIGSKLSVYRLNRT